MRITPLDVRKQEFRKAVRGYDSDEVRGFLTTLAEEYETVLVDNKTLRENIAKQEDKLHDYEQIESTLRDTLMTAQKVMADTKANAERESTLIVEQARQKAGAILDECRARTEDLRREILMLRKEKETYLARFRALAQAQIQFVDAHEQDFAGLDQRLVAMADAAVGVVTGPVPSAPASVVQAGPVSAPSAKIPESEAATPSAHDQWRDYTPLTKPATPHEAAPTPVADPEPEVDGTEEVASTLAEAVELASRGIPVTAGGGESAG